jgi:CBS domain-containing protein
VTIVAEPEAVTVRDVMSAEIVSVGAAATVAEAATLMGKLHVGSALVMDDEAPVGIFTERDIVRALAADFDAAGHSVSHWMTADPETVEPGITAHEALERMLTGGYRHLPVVEEGRTIGIVSIRDLSRAIAGP